MDAGEGCCFGAPVLIFYFQNLVQKKVPRKDRLNILSLGFAAVPPCFADPRLRSFGSEECLRLL